MLINGLHLADNSPYAWETRWINVKILPQALEVDFSSLSANEWLVQNAPYARGSYTVAARLADATAVDALNCRLGDPLVVVDRYTLDGSGCGITQVELCYAVGHCLSGDM